MTESSAGYPAPAPPPDDCPDPYRPYTDYRITVAVAKQRSDLYTADAEVVKPKYDKLKDAQTRYQTAWAAQKSAWEDLKCRLKRVAETLDHTLDESTRTHLLDCWKEILKEPDPAPAPANCGEIDALDCDKVDDLAKATPSGDENAKLRRLASFVDACVKQVDDAYDALAGFPEVLAPQITALAARVTKLDQDLAASGNDPRRSYVEYLAVHRDFCRLEEQLTTAAKYACRLKVAFQKLLKTHITAICIKVAVYALDKRAEIEAEAKKAKAESVVDLVLECAKDQSSAATPTPPPGEHPYEPKPSSEGTASVAY